MSFPLHSKELRRLLNGLYIPDITEPYHIKVHWIRSVVPSDEAIYISEDDHIHTFFELHIMAKGTFSYTTGDDKAKLSLKAGHALFLPPGYSHIVKGYDPDANKFTISFSPDKSSPLYKALKNSSAIPFTANDKIYALLSEIMEECKVNSLISPYLIRNKIFEIIFEATRLLSIPEELPDSGAIFEDKRVTDAKIFIRDNSHRLITCSEVAAHCGISTKQMTRIFFAHTGKSLSYYIHTLRLSKAEKFLTETIFSIKEISEKLGFSNVYSFTSFFTKKAGITPGAYRKRYMKEEIKNVNISRTL